MNQNNCKVEWWSVVPGLAKVEPVQSATKFIPPWFKNMPKFLNYKDIYQDMSPGHIYPLTLQI